MTAPVLATPAFAATANEIVVLPWPVALLVMVIQFTSDFAVHEHALFVATTKLPLPPAAVNDALAGAGIAYPHEMPACATENIRPAIVRLP